LDFSSISIKCVLYHFRGIEGESESRAKVDKRIMCLLVEIRIRINRKADCLGIVRFFAYSRTPQA
jgi:hypothetical protein